MSALGVCKLCGAYGSLVRSHIELPSFVYKRLRADTLANPNPVQISNKGVRQICSQQRSPLLCSKCDGDRFGALGERWVSSVCLQADLSFPLKDLVLSAPCQSNDIDTALYRTHNTAGISHRALEYFAASMIWRAQFLPTHPISLGAYDPQFRAYLLGEQSFPEAATLIIGIRHRSNITRLSHSVVGSDLPNGATFCFSIPGMYFNLILDENPQSLFRLACFVHAPDRLIFDSDVIDYENDERVTRLTLEARDAGKRWRVTDDSEPHHLSKS